MDYNSWSTIWGTRGYLPKNKRTGDTVENKHRATHKPLMNSEKLVYNSKEDCFEVYWGYKVDPFSHSMHSHPNLIFKCYRNFWKLYPGTGNDWLARGKVARINKYCPLQNSWMHISKGVVQVYGWGAINDGFVLTKTRASMQAKHTVHGVRLGIQTALDYGTKPGAARNIGSRSDNSSAVADHAPHYTRDQIAKIVNYYINQQVTEFCNKLIYADGERNTISYEKTSGFHDHPIIVQERGTSGFDGEIYDDDNLKYINGLHGRRSNFNTSSFSLLNVFGLHMLKDSKDDEPEYIKINSIGPRYPYSSTLQSYLTQPTYAQRDQNANFGARKLLAHVFSYCYYQSSIFQTRTKLNELPKHASIPSSHVLLFLSVLVYCDNTLHGFEPTFMRIFGKQALDALKEHDIKHVKILTGAACIKSYTKADNASFASFWSYLFESGLLKTISDSLWDYRQYSDMTFSKLKSALPEIRQAMTSFFKDIIKHGVDYREVGFSPFSTIAINYPEQNCCEHVISTAEIDGSVIRTPHLDSRVSIKAVPVSPSQLICTGATRDSSEINVTALSKLDNLNDNSNCLELLDQYCFDEQKIEKPNK